MCIDDSLGSESHSTCTHAVSKSCHNETVGSGSSYTVRSPGPVGQDWPLLPEGAQPPYDDHDSLQDAKVSYHPTVNTKVLQPSQGLKIGCFINLLIQIQVLY